MNSGLTPFRCLQACVSKYTVASLDKNGIVPYFKIKESETSDLLLSVGDAGRRARGAYHGDVPTTLCVRAAILPLVILVVTALFSLTAVRAAASGGPEFLVQFGETG